MELTYQEVYFLESGRQNVPSGIVIGGYNITRVEHMIGFWPNQFFLIKEGETTVFMDWYKLNPNHPNDCWTCPPTFIVSRGNKHYKCSFGSLKNISQETKLTLLRMFVDPSEQIPDILSHEGYRTVMARFENIGEAQITRTLNEFFTAVERLLRWPGRIVNLLTFKLRFHLPDTRNILDSMRP